MIGWLAARVRREARKVTQEAVTDALMVLAVPVDMKPTYAALALGRDLDAPVPPLLGAAHPFLDSFVKEHDPCPPGGTQCAAKDWCDLRQRMHYIVHLFRAYAGHAVAVCAAVHGGAGCQPPARRHSRWRAVAE